MISGARAMRRGAAAVATRRGGLGIGICSEQVGIAAGSIVASASSARAHSSHGRTGYFSTSRALGHLLLPQGASWNSNLAFAASRHHAGSASRLLPDKSLQPRWISSTTSSAMPPRATTDAPSDSPNTTSAPSADPVAPASASAAPAPPRASHAVQLAELVRQTSSSHGSKSPAPVRTSALGNSTEDQPVARRPVERSMRRQFSSSSGNSSPSASAHVATSSKVAQHWTQRWLNRFAKKVYDGTRRTAKKVKSLTVAAAKDPRVMREWAGDIYDAIIHFCQWVVTGFRLFSINVGASYHLATRIFQGYHLTVRERNLLVRTTSDCLKLVPFSFFLIVPFAELLLPIALRLFPNLMPSTFFESKYDNATLARKFEAKQQMAEFWQAVIAQRTQKILEADNHAYANKAVELQAFEDKLMSGRDFPSVKEILHFSKLFKQEMQLSAMTDDQLRAMSKMLGLTPMTLLPHNVLQLRHHITSLRREDRDYMWEGLDSLTKHELIEACRRRAIRFHGVTTADMKRDLTRWLEISANKEVPTSLLLWIQSFYLTSEETIHQTKDILHPGGPEPKAFQVQVKEELEVELEVEEEAKEAFHGMAERRKAKVESAQHRLEELKHELDEVIREEQAQEETEDKVQKTSKDKKADEVMPAPTSPPDGSRLEEEQETKRCILKRIEELSKAQELNRSIIEKQRNMLNHQIEFMAHMRDNAPLKNQDAGRILLDQRVRLVEMMRSYGEDLEEIEQLLEEADKVTEVTFAKGDLDYISQLFHKLDINQDGIISKREFEQAVLDGRFDPKTLETASIPQPQVAAGNDSKKLPAVEGEWVLEEARSDRDVRNGTPRVGISEEPRSRDSLHA